jgi:glycosyltransferase involved in cell wall biosynthesis
VAGEAATLFNPLDTGSISRSVERLIEDEPLRRSQRQAGLERSRAFDWDRAAAETLSTYRRLLAR